MKLYLRDIKDFYVGVYSMEIIIEGSIGRYTHFYMANNTSLNFIGLHKSSCTKLIIYEV